MSNELSHLARRFALALRPPAATAEAEAWVRDRLTPAQWELWSRQRPDDRRHTAAAAQALLAAHADAPAWVVEAALLHDVGKVEVQLGVGLRVIATALRLVHVERGPGSIGSYLAYPTRGATMLRDLGSDPNVVAWAAEHHRRSKHWTVPAPWARRLADADRRAL